MSPRSSGSTLPETREGVIPLTTNETILEDMLEPRTIQDVLEALGKVTGAAAGVFTPGCKRIGKPANHSDFCKLLYKSATGKAACGECDKAWIDALIAGRKLEPYPCHADLIDFCDPIVCTVNGETQLVGAIFAGQVLYEGDEMTKERVGQVRELARLHGVDEDSLLAAYAELPRLSVNRVRHIRSLTRQFAWLIGGLVKRKAATQLQLLKVMQSADDHSALVETVKTALDAAAVSIFLRMPNAPEEFSDSIFLVASTNSELAETSKTIQDAIAFGTTGQKMRIYLRHFSYAPREGLTGWVYATGRTLHIPDVRSKGSFPNDPFSANWIHKVKEVPAAEAHAFLGAPIRSADGNVIGVIRAVRKHTKHGFSDEEVQTLSAVASLVGAAVFRATRIRRLTDLKDALSETQYMLEAFERADSSIETVADAMATVLADRFVPKSYSNHNWETVYVVRYNKPAKIFRIVAAVPDNVPSEPHKDFTFGEDDGVIAELRRNVDRIEYLASNDCREDGLSPAKPWDSVVEATIRDRDDSMWGAVALCGNGLSEEDVNVATPVVVRFAKHMSLVCRVSEVFESTKNNAIIGAADMVSLVMEAHENFHVLKNLQANLEYVIDIGGVGTGGEAALPGDWIENAEAAASQVRECISWAIACSEMGRFLRRCSEKADLTAAVDSFRQERIPKDPGGRTQAGTWQQIDLRTCIEKAVESVSDSIEKFRLHVAVTLADNAVLIGDDNILYRAFRNLLENIFKHGCNTSDSQTLYDVPVGVSMSVDGKTGTAKIVIEDEGVGIPPHTLETLNEVYDDPSLFGKSGRVPGFGSMIVSFAAAVHKGQVRIDSERRKGTRTTMEIPLLLKR